MEYIIIGYILPLYIIHVGYLWYFLAKSNMEKSNSQVHPFLTKRWKQSLTQMRPEIQAAFLLNLGSAWTIAVSLRVSRIVKSKQNFTKQPRPYTSKPRFILGWHCVPSLLVPICWSENFDVKPQLFLGSQKKQQSSRIKRWCPPFFGVNIQLLLVNMVNIPNHPPNLNGYLPHLAPRFSRNLAPVASLSSATVDPSHPQRMASYSCRQT